MRFKRYIFLIIELLLSKYYSNIHFMDRGMELLISDFNRIFSLGG